MVAILSAVKSTVCPCLSMANRGGMSGPQFMVKDQKDAVTGIIPCNENQV
jgi:hypothetical protein